MFNFSKFESCVCKNQYQIANNGDIKPYNCFAGVEPQDNKGFRRSKYNDLLKTQYQDLEIVLS